MSRPRTRVPKHPARGRAAWWLVLLLFVALAAGIALAIQHGIAELGHAPVSVVIDGEEVVRGLDLASISAPHQLLAALILTVLVLVALVMLPLALLFGALLALAVGLAVLSVPLLALLAVLLLLCSPLLVVLALLWWWLRGRRTPAPSPAPAGAATMPR